MGISEIIIQAKEKKAQQVMLLVGGEPQMHDGREWSTLRREPFLASEWNILQQSILTNSQKQDFEERGVLAGEGLFGSAHVDFSFYQDQKTMKAVLNFHQEAAEESTLPAALWESAFNKKGLILLSGQQESQLRALNSALLARLNREKKMNVLVVSPTSFAPLKEDRVMFMSVQAQHFSRLNTAERESLFAGVDCIIFHDLDGQDYFSSALRLAEKNRLVIYSTVSSHLLSSLGRLMDQLPGRHDANRLAEVLSLGIGQLSLSALQGAVANAYEVLPVQTQVRSKIAHQDLLGLDLMLRNSSENSGFVNMNQSLLQLLIRRRVDLKTAFSASRDPEELDQMLKKVGL